MRFVADENLEAELIAAIRADGHDVRSLAESARQLPDATILAQARREARVVLTDDKDFGELVFRLRLAPSGIVLFRYSESLISRQIADFLALLRSGARLDGHFTVIRPGRVRSRPIGS